MEYPHLWIGTNYIFNPGPFSIAILDYRSVAIHCQVAWECHHNTVELHTPWRTKPRNSARQPSAVAQWRHSAWSSAPMQRKRRALKQGLGIQNILDIRLYKCVYLHHMLHSIALHWMYVFMYNCLYVCMYVHMWACDFFIFQRIDLPRIGELEKAFPFTKGISEETQCLPSGKRSHSNGISPFSIGHTSSIRVHFPASYVSLPANNFH